MLLYSYLCCSLVVTQPEFDTIIWYQYHCGAYITAYSVDNHQYSSFSFKNSLDRISDHIPAGTTASYRRSLNPVSPLVLSCMFALLV